MGKLSVVALNKPLFVMIIENMCDQYAYDKKCAEMACEMFGTESSGLYNNSKYLVSIMSLLRLHFPKSEQGFCEIEHYCFCLDFGKVGDEYESSEQLYDRLVSLNT